MSSSTKTTNKISNTATVNSGELLKNDSNAEMIQLLDTTQAMVNHIAEQPGMGNYLEHCSGVLFLSGNEYALGLSGQQTTGLLLKHFKTIDTWSLPVAMKLQSIGLGINLGYEAKEMIIFLDDRQLRAFSQNATLRFGSEIGYAISIDGAGGLEGDSYLDVSDLFHFAFSGAYTETKGWRYGFPSLQGGVMHHMWKVNRDFYGDLWNPKGTKTVAERIMAGDIARSLTLAEEARIDQLRLSLKEAIAKQWVPMVPTRQEVEAAAQKV